jgi:hypothetical protein
MVVNGHVDGELARSSFAQIVYHKYRRYLMSTSVHYLNVNPAQMRTRVGLQELAELAVQVKDGIDPNLALLLKPDGQGEFNVVSGHRRWLALMIAHIAYAGAQVSPVSVDEDVELMASTIGELCTVVEGFVKLDEEVYETLKGLVPESLTVPYALWDGAAADEVLLLIRANMGAEEPDLLGQANAYLEATQRGVSYDTLSQVTGRPVLWLEALVNVLDLPAIFRILVRDDLLDLAIVPELRGLEPNAIKALGRVMERKYRADKKRMAAQELPVSPYTAKVRLAVVQMGGPPPELPDRKDAEPKQYNKAAVALNLWQYALENSPVEVYEAIAVQSLDGHRINHLTGLMDTLALISSVGDYLDVDPNAWGRDTVRLSDAAAQEFLPSWACDTCAFIDLPAERVRHELPFPCRSKSTGVASGPCLHWVPKGERFAIRTPIGWRNGYKQVTTFKALLKEWEAQRKREQEAPAVLESGASVNMDELRDKIQSYMDTHTEFPFLVHHPWATPCERCAYHLEESPVKSAPDAPHCGWAKGRRRLRFEAYIPKDAGAVAALADIIPEGEALVPFYTWEELEVVKIPYLIPSCLQFKPVEQWAELIYEAAAEPPYSREILLQMLDEMALSVNRHAYAVDSRAALQFLTGRPEKSSANHRLTFRHRLKKEESFLNDRQLWTLFEWLLLEWLRVSVPGPQHVPFGGGQTVETRLMDFWTAMHKD